MIVDAHTHVVPEGMPFGLTGDARWPELRTTGDGADVVIAGQVFRRIDRVTWDPLRRIDAMAADGVDVHVVSPMPELFSYWSEPTDARRFCGAVNEWIAEFVAAAPARFHGLGILPLQDVDTALAMVDDAAALELRGVMVGSHVNGTSISDEQYLPLWRALARRDLSVFVHAFHPLHTEMFESRIANAVTFPWEIGFATSALIARAVPFRVPDLRLAVSHGGGGAIPTLPRLVNAWEADGRVRAELSEHPLAIARRIYYDALVFDRRVVDLLADFVGTDRLLLGSDFPFMRTPCHHVVRGSRIARGAENLVHAENTLRWLGLSTGDGAIGVR